LSRDFGFNSATQRLQVMVVDLLWTIVITHCNGLTQFRLYFFSDVLLYEKLDSQSVRVLKDGLREGASIGA